MAWSSFCRYCGYCGFMRGSGLTAKCSGVARNMSIYSKPFHPRIDSSFYGSLVPKLESRNLLTMQSIRIQTRCLPVCHISTSKLFRNTDSNKDSKNTDDQVQANGEKSEKPVDLVEKNEEKKLRFFIQPGDHDYEEHQRKKWEEKTQGTPDSESSNEHLQIILWVLFIGGTIFLCVRTYNRRQEDFELAELQLEQNLRAEIFWAEYEEHRRLEKEQEEKTERAQKLRDMNIDPMYQKTDHAEIEPNQANIARAKRMRAARLERLRLRREKEAEEKAAQEAAEAGQIESSKK